MVTIDIPGARKVAEYEDSIIYMLDVGVPNPTVKIQGEPSHPISELILDVYEFNWSYFRYDNVDSVSGILLISPEYLFQYQVAMQKDYGSYLYASWMFQVSHKFNGGSSKLAIVNITSRR